MTKAIVLPLYITRSIWNDTTIWTWRWTFKHWTRKTLVLFKMILIVDLLNCFFLQIGRCHSPYCNHRFSKWNEGTCWHTLGSHYPLLISDSFKQEIFFKFFCIWLDSFVFFFLLSSHFSYFCSSEAIVKLLKTKKSRPEDKSKKNEKKMNWNIVKWDAVNNVLNDRENGDKLKIK